MLSFGVHVSLRRGINVLHLFHFVHKGLSSHFLLLRDDLSDVNLLNWKCIRLHLTFRRSLASSVGFQD